jgi:hypothetical protein
VRGLFFFFFRTNLSYSCLVSKVTAILDGYLLSMACDDIVVAIVQSLECRKTLLEVSSTFPKS